MKTFESAQVGDKVYLHHLEGKITEIFEDRFPSDIRVKFNGYDDLYFSKDGHIGNVPVQLLTWLPTQIEIPDKPEKTDRIVYRDNSGVHTSDSVSTLEEFKGKYPTVEWFCHLSDFTCAPVRK